MKLSDTVNDGLVQEMDDWGSSTVNTYPFKKKVSDLNDALDWYCMMAFKVGLAWEFDDINETSPPIDTQDIVSGTNRYKVSDFTEKIIKLIRLEILDDSGAGHILIPETFDTIGSPTLGNTSGVISGVVNDTFQELYLNPDSGRPTHYIKNGDYIYLRPSPNYNETAGLKAYFNRAALQFLFIPFTVTIASPGVFSATAHGLSAGDTVILETDGALPTGLTADTQYYVISAGLTADAFELSTTSGGSAINTTGSQSGNHAFLKTSGEPGIVSVHHRALARKATLNYLSKITSPKLGVLPQLVAVDEAKIMDYFSTRDKDIKKIMSIRQQDNR